MLDEISTYAGASARLIIFSGVQPAGGGTETTRLAELTCDVSAFASSATGGLLTINPITQDSAANASGTATWFRIYQTGETVWVMDGDISTQLAGTGDLQLDDTAIVLNGTVSLSGPNSISAPNAP